MTASRVRIERSTGGRGVGRSLLVRRCRPSSRTGLTLAVAVAEAVADAAHREDVLRLLRRRARASRAGGGCGRRSCAGRGRRSRPRSARAAPRGVNTRPGLRASTPRISNSTNVVRTSSPRTRTVRLAKSIRSSPASSGSSASSRGRSAGRGAHRRAAQRRLDAAAELAHRERLGDVVVGAELEAEHLVDLLGLGRQHDDRHRARGAQPPAHLEAVEVGHHHVEHDEVEVALGEALERLDAVGRAHHLVAVLAQRVGEQREDRLLVVDEQDACGSLGHRLPRHRLSNSGRPDSPSSTTLGVVLDLRLYRVTLLPFAVRADRRRLLAARRAAASPATAPPAQTFDGDHRRVGDARARRRLPGPLARVCRRRRARRRAGAPRRRVHGLAGPRRAACRVVSSSVETTAGAASVRTVLREPRRRRRRRRHRADRGPRRLAAGAAALAPTATLLELASIYRELLPQRPLTLVSTSGGASAMGAVAALLPPDTEAAIVIGDVTDASGRGPYVVPVVGLRRARPDPVAPNGRGCRRLRALTPGRRPRAESSRWRGSRCR